MARNPPEHIPVHHVSAAAIKTNASGMLLSQCMCGPFLSPFPHQHCVRTNLQGQIREPCRIRRAEGTCGPPRNLAALAHTTAIQLYTTARTRVIVISNSATASDLHASTGGGGSSDRGLRSAGQYGAGAVGAVQPDLATGSQPASGGCVSYRPCKCLPPRDRGRWLARIRCDGAAPAEFARCGQVRDVRDRSPPSRVAGERAGVTVRWSAASVSPAASRAPSRAS